MQATFYGLHEDSVRPKLRNMVPSIGLGFGEDNNWENGAKGVLDVGVIGGVFVPGSVVDNDQNAVVAGPQGEGFGFGASQGSNYIKTKMVSRVSGSGIRLSKKFLNRKMFLAGQMT